MSAPAEAFAARIADKVRRIEIQTRRLGSDALHGGIASRFLGRGLDFDEIREYAPGDDVRAIAWGATARSGRAFVKKYREERALTVVFVVDMSASGALGSGDASKREQAIEIAGVLALSAVRSDHHVGLQLFTDRVEEYVPPARGRAHAFRVLQRLVTHTPKRSGTDIAGALRTLRETLRKRAVVVVLSDFMVSEAALALAANELRALGRRHDVVLLRTGDPHDRVLPEIGLLTLEDAETGEVVEIDTSSRRQRRELEAAIEATDERIRMLARGARADLLELDTLKPWLGPLLGFFRGRGLRS